MEFALKRDTLTSKSTLGKLYIDGEYQCETLEDPIREVRSEGKWYWMPEYKLPGITAIPSGEYRVIITQSNRFGRDMPLLLNVPDFVGVRIHTGNKPENTEGCILVGQDRAEDWISESRAAFSALFDRLVAAREFGDEVKITITNEI